MKRSFNDQQESLSSSSNYTTSYNLASETYSAATANHGPVSLSHASGLAYQQTVAAPLKASYSASESRNISTSSAPSIAQSNQVPQASTNNLTPVRAQGYLPDPLSKLETGEAAKLTSEANLRVVKADSVVRTSTAENMQSSVQSFPPQMQTSYQ